MDYFIVKQIDGLGRIVIPKECRKEAGFELNSDVAVTVKDGNIIISHFRPRCKICGSYENVDEVIPLCPRCLKTAKSRE